MKKILSVFVAVILLFSAVPCQSFAVKCQYATTQSFLDYLDKKDIRYNWKGLDNGDNELVIITYSGENMDTIELNWFFKKDEVGIRVWDVITYSPQNYYYVLDTVNSLGAQYRYTYLFLDTSDNTVVAQLDMPLAGDGVGDICYEILRNFLTVIDDFVYPELRQYDTAA